MTPTHVPARRLGATMAALVFIATCAAFVPRTGEAMTVLYADLPELVRVSEFVLYGKIVDVQVIDRRRDGRAVWTEYSLAVREVWKGKKAHAGKVFKWRHIGGTTRDGMTLSVPGMPTFAVGESTIVLLERHSEGHTLTGASQGKFTVTRDTKKRLVAERHLGGVHFVYPPKHRPKSGPMQVSIARPGQPIPAKLVRDHWLLPELRAQVIGYVKADARRPKPAAKTRLKARRGVPVKAPPRVRP